MLKDNITLCLNIFMSTYVFSFNLVSVRNFSTRAGCYNAFLHQCIAAHFSRYFCVYDEGLLLNYYTSCTIFKIGLLKKNSFSIPPLYLEMLTSTNRTKAGKCPSCEKNQCLLFILILIRRLSSSVSKLLLCRAAEFRFPIGKGFILQ
jgi:hypothetical protein